MSDNWGSSSVEWANLEHSEGIKKADKNRIMSYYIFEGYCLYDR